MAYQELDIGSVVNDGTGDTLPVAGDKINDNFLEIYTLIGDGTSLTSGISATATVVTLTAPTITGVVAGTQTSATITTLTGTTFNAGTLALAAGSITDSSGTINFGNENLTTTGIVTAASLDISGNVDVDGTLETDALTIGGVTLAETIADTVGAMVSSNTETNITVTYEDSDNTLDFVIGTLNQSTSGNAATATALETARTIHGVSFDGTANIDLSEVVQDTVGAMFSSNTETNITATYQDGDGTIDLVIGTLNQDTTGSAATLTTARTIGGTSFDGSANIAVALATLATTVTVTDNESTNESNAIIFTAGGDVDGGNLGLESDGTLTYNPSTGKITATGFVGTLTGNVTGNTSGTAATVTGAAQTNITSVGTLTALQVDNININGNDITSTAGTDLTITPVSGQQIVLDGAIVIDAGVVTGATSITSTAFVGDITGDVTGNADTATTLATARTIGGTSFDGSANIAVALATLATTVTITDNESTNESNALIFTAGGDVDGGNLGLESDGTLTYNPSTGKVTATGFVGTLTGNVTGNTSGTAATVTGAAQTAITSVGTLTALQVDNININGNAITSTAGTDLTITPVAGQQIVLDGTIVIDAGVVTGATSITSTAFVGDITGDVTGTADVATVATTVTITDNESTNESNALIFTAGGDVDGGNLGLESDGTLTYNPSTGKVTATGFIGALTGNASGTAATVTGAAQTAITSVGTLTALQVDNININGNAITSTAGTDLTIAPVSGQQIVLDGTIVIDAGVVTGATSITSTAFVGDITGDVTGNADTATALATARTIGGTSFDGSANIAVALATLATTVTITDNESTNENNVIVFVAGADADGGNVGLESDGNLTYNPSTGTLSATNIVISGTQTIADTVTMQAENAIVFEGATADDHETTLTIIDPTADRTINLPNQSGTVPVLAAASNTAITSTPAELNKLDGATVVVGEINALDLGSTAVGTAIASKAVILDSNKDYTGIRNLTISGEIDAATGDYSGAVDIAGATTTAAITASGIIKTDDSTAATSTTDGSLQTDGGLSVVLDAVIGDDLFLLSDAAVLTFGADKDVTVTHVADAGIMINAAMQLRFRDSAISIGSPADGDLDINADDEIELNSTLIDVNGNLDVSGTGVIAGAVTTAALTASGIIKTDDSTAATSTTDGSLQTDGGLSVVLDAVIGDDLIMLSDAAVIHFGADSDVTLTHVADTGLLLNGTSVIQFNDASQNIGAPSNAILDINATDEIELNATLLDVNANINASGTYTGAGTMTTGGNIVIPNAGNIGSVGDTDSIAIASNGVVTFSQAPVFPDGSIAVADLDIDGATDIGAALADADLFIVDDGAGGANRKSTLARIKTYINASASGSVNADDVAGGDAAVLITTSSGNITLDAAANNTDIIFKGTDGGSDLVFLTIDGSEAGEAIFNAGIVIGDAGTIGSASDKDAIAIGSDGDVTLTQDLELQHDGAILSFGADDDVTLTHVHNAGVMFNAAMQMRFRDSAISIGSPADGDLDINADDEIELNSTLIDINGNVEISGTLAQADAITMATNKKLIFRDSAIHISSTADGDLSIAADDEIDITSTLIDVNGNLDVSGTIVSAGVITGTAFTAGSAVLAEAELELLDGLTAGTAIASKVVTTDSNIDTTGQRNLTISGEIDAATGDYSGAVDIAGATTTAAITASGIIKTDDSTAATSTTDGSLQTDGGLSVVLDAVIGDDIILISDAAQIAFGVNSEITLAHVHNVGLTLTHVTAGDNLPVVLQLKSEEDVVVANEVIGSIEFAAGDSDGTDGATVAAGIHAIAEGTFSASANATKLVFTTGVSETAASSATAKATLSSIGDFTVAGDLIIKDGGTIGSASDLDAIAIASNGVVTFSQIPVMPANSIDSDEYIDGSIDTAHIADNQITLAKMAGIARGKIIYGDASGDPAVLAPGDDGQVLASDGTDISWADVTATSLAADNLSAGDAAVTITTSSGNITIDAAANNSDVIFKGTDGGADITMLTLDGSADGAAIFKSTVTATGIIIGSTAVTSTAAELNALDGITAVVGELNALDIGSTAVGTAVASKAVILDSNKDYTGIRNLTISGEIDAATGDYSGAVDIAGATTVVALTASGIIKTDDSTAATSTTDGSLQTDGGLSVVLDAVIGDDLFMLSDAAVITFGADKDVTLTHVADTGLLLNAAMAIQFRDSAISIASDNDGDLMIAADDEIDITSTLIDINGNVTISGTTGAAAVTTSTIVASGIIKTDDTTAATSTTDGSLQTDGGLSVAADAVIGDDLFMLSDAAVITFGADKDVTLTHVADTGLLLNAAMAIQFRDSAISIGSTADGDLSIAADDEIDITSTLIDINGNLDVSGTGVIAGAVTTAALTASGIIKTDDTTAATSTTDGSLQTDGGLSVAADAVIGDDLFLLSDAAVLTFGADKDVTLTHVADTGLLLNAAMAIQFRDSAISIGSTADGDLSIAADDEIDITSTLIDINGNVTISGTTGAAAVTTSTIVASGIIKTDDSTAATTTTDGSLQTDGGLSVVLDAVIGDDIILISDAAQIAFGVNSDVILKHVHNVGLTATHVGTGDNLPMVLQLKSEENALVANEVIASLEFAAGDSDGTDGATVAAGIHAIAEDTFSASVNKTKLVFTTGVSETAASSATAKATLSSIGDFEVAGDLVVKDGGLIGSTSDKDAMSISSGGVVNFTARPTFAASLTIQDGGSLGSASDTNAITISSGGVVAVTAATASTSATSGALTVGGGAGIAADLSVGDDLFMISDAAVITFGADKDVTLTHVADTGLLLNAAMVMQFRDSAINIGSPADGDLDINADDEIELNSTLIDINGNVDISGTLAQADAITMATNKKIIFRDTAIHISSTADGDLSIAADDEIDLTSTLIDLNGNVEISGNLTVSGTTTQVDTVTMNAENAVVFEGATADAHETTLTIIDPTADRTQRLINQSGYVPLLAAVTTTAITSTPAELNILDGATVVVGEINALDIGSTAVGTAVASKAVILDSNKDYTGIRNLTITGELDAATLDISGAIDIAGATATAAITASGIIKTDDSTAATSTTDGSLQTDGGLSVVLDAVIGDDLIMLSDAAVMHFGADSDVTLTHVADTGLLLNAAMVVQFRDSAINIGSPADGDLDINADDEVEINSTLIDINGNLDVSGTGVIAGAVTTAALTASGIIKTDDTTAATSTTDGSLQTDGGLSVAADAVIGDDLFLLSDAAVLTFGADKDVTVTHVADNGIMINAAMQLRFRDSAISIGSPADGDLDINADDEIELNSTLIDVNGNLDVSGTGVIAGAVTTAALTASGIMKTDDTTAATSTTDGSLQTDGGLSVAADAVIGDDLFLLSDLAVLTFGADKDVTLTHAHNTGLTLNAAMILMFRDNAINIGSPADGDLDINADDEIELNSTLIDINGNVEISGTTAAAAMTMSTIVASGIIKTDDSTAATSTTDGSLQTDGGLSVALDAVIGDDIMMLSDAAMIHFGASKEITLMHVHNVGLTLTHATAGDNLPIVLQLKSEEDVIVANEVIASLEFAAGDSDGTDGATVAAGIHAIAEDTFSASVNKTKLVFTTGVSETAASSATAKATLSSIGDFQVAGDLVVKDGGLIGSASDLDAMAIASNGVVTFTQIPVMPANSIDSDEYIDGSIDRAHLSADIIDGTKIADDAINSEHYADGSIDTAHIAADQITEAKMANDAISSVELKTLSTLLIKNSGGTTLKTCHTAGA